MKQADLNRAVARALGETVAVIEHRGFSLVPMPRPRKKHRAHRRRNSSTNGPHVVKAELVGQSS